MKVREMGRGVLGKEEEPPRQTYKTWQRIPEMPLYFLILLAEDIESFCFKLIFQTKSNKFFEFLFSKTNRSLLF